MDLFQLVDVASPRKVVVTYTADRVVHTVTWDTPGREAERVLPAMLAGVEAAGASLGDLRRLLVVHGPGSFTGLRVAVTVANVLGVTYPELQLCPLTEGMLLAAADGFEAPRYVFASYASDVFLFSGDGTFLGRVAGSEFSPQEGDAGILTEQIPVHDKIRPVDPARRFPSSTFLCSLHEYAPATSGQMFPFYAKEANITTPKYHVPVMQPPGDSSLAK